MRRKPLVLMIILYSISFLIYSQEIEVDEIDEFTGNEVKRTTWETLNADMKFTAYFRISKINDNTYFDLKMMMVDGSVFSIDKDQEIMFKLENDEVVKLPNLQYEITCKGCGAIGFGGSAAQGIHVSYPINKEDAQRLISFNITKIRIYTNQGYFEKEPKEKNVKKISNALKLLIDE